MFVRTNRFRRAGAAAVALAATVVLAGCGDKTGPSNKQSALRPAGPYAHKILNLFTPFFWIAVVIGIGVISATLFVALRFREKPGEERMPVQTHGNVALEIGWTIIPALILMVMAVPTVATIFDLAKRPTGPNVIHVEVSARQWWWQFTYTDPGNNIVTANELHIPVGQPVALTLVGPPACSTGCYNNGVIHSFWVPELNGKKDVVPGRTQFLSLQADRPGTFLGQCAEYCGLSHANMRLRVIAQTPADYQAWVRRQLQPLSADALQQFSKFNQSWGCLQCHSADPTKPGAIAPNLTHLADRCMFAGDIYQVNEQNLTNWIYDAPSMKPMGTLSQHMPNFSSEGMTKDQANQIAKFLLSNTGTSQQQPPAECKS